jgi:hypothetical protein
MSGFFQPSLLASQGESASGFWSIIDDVIPGAQQGIGQVASNVFPNWVESQLQGQQKNFLDRELFNQAFAQPRVEQVGNFQTAASGSLNMKEIAILGGVAILGLVVAMKI